MQFNNNCVKTNQNLLTNKSIINDMTNGRKGPVTRSQTKYYQSKKGAVTRSQKKITNEEYQQMLNQEKPQRKTQPKQIQYSTLYDSKEGVTLYFIDGQWQKHR